ncbi:MAG: DNA-3-methyladenine glycosylase 2 family protein [Ferruginibacter sp.]|nr:DNA-3-methyladenine glycosylase 2 family protein [Ferruginibacter sp.]
MTVTGPVSINGIQTFSESSFNIICDHLAKQDPDLQAILDTHQYPPCWQRSASFETLVHIILEQQVSLASAMAALNKLKQKTADITPANLLALSNEELRDCYFSRQKIIYAKHLASAFLNDELNIDALSAMDNDTVRSTLTKIKGIGNWSADVYLMMVLQRCDLFPLGDVALMTSVRETKKLSKDSSKIAIAAIASAWKPYQTIAAFILWHSYLCKRKRKSQ